MLSPILNSLEIYNSNSLLISVVQMHLVSLLYRVPVEMMDCLVLLAHLYVTHFEI